MNDPSTSKTCSQPFSYFCSQGNNESLYGSQLFYLSPTTSWAPFALDFNNLCRKLLKSKRKTDNGQPPALPTHPVPPTQPLGCWLPWTKLTLSCSVLMVWISVGPSLWDTSEPCLHNTIWLSPCAQVVRLPEAFSSSSSSSPLGSPGDLIKSSLRLYHRLQLSSKLPPEDRICRKQ